jgi:1-acyl-sn-glycerol-3-phosphate acyltransferase
LFEDIAGWLEILLDKMVGKSSLNKERSYNNISLAYRCFKAYLRFLFEHVMYRKVHYINTQSVPENGVPTLIASNHQNGLSDALAILMSFRKKKKVRFIVRADVFSIAPGVNRFLRSIGLLPAFRINHEGEKSLSNNASTFRDSEKDLADGNSVVIFPEGGHQTGHWLGNFSFGYTRMAFDAAEMLNFEKDIVILPACNHYSSYFGIRQEYLVEYGTPISLKPYYELYKVKPRTAQRQVNKLVCEQIKNMMYRVTDLEYYDELEFIRNSSYGREYARRRGLNPDSFTDKFESDKDLVGMLEKATGRDVIKYYINSRSTGWEVADGPLVEGTCYSIVNPKEVPAEKPIAYERARVFKNGLESAGIDEKYLDKPATAGGIFMKILGMLLLLPVAIVALWPSAVSWLVPKHFEKKMEDRMFQGTLLMAINALFIYPILAIITLAVVWPLWGFVQAICWVLLFPALCVFEWNYVGWFKGLRKDFAAKKAQKAGKIKEIINARSAMSEELDKLLKYAE